MSARRSFATAIAAHEVVWAATGQAYRVEAREGQYRSVDAVGAAQQAIRVAHLRSGVPPWRSLLKQSAPHIRVQAIEAEPGRRR